MCNQLATNGKAHEQTDHGASKSIRGSEQHQNQAAHLIVRYRASSKQENW